MTTISTRLEGAKAARRQTELDAYRQIVQSRDLNDDELMRFSDSLGFSADDFESHRRAIKAAEYQRQALADAPTPETIASLADAAKGAEESAYEAALADLRALFERVPSLEVFDIVISQFVAPNCNWNMGSAPTTRRDAMTAMKAANDRHSTAMHHAERAAERLAGIKQSIPWLFE